MFALLYHNTTKTIIKSVLFQEYDFFSIDFIRVPFQRVLWSATIYQVVKLLPSPRFFKSHLPDHLIPPDVFTKRAKIVYVARNPKDLAVSYYYFCRWQPMMPKFETWDEFFDAFMEGRGEYYVSFSCPSKAFYRKRLGTNTSIILSVHG